MDFNQTLADYETARNSQYKDELLKELIADDPKTVKSLGNPYTGHARSLARQGVIKLPKGFQSYAYGNHPGLRPGAVYWHIVGVCQ